MRVLDMADTGALHTTEQGIVDSASPCGSRMGSRWYCISTHPQREHEVYGRLIDQGFETYLPLWLDRGPIADRILPMFRGYLFVCFDRERDKWRKVCSTRGVWFLLSSGPENPTPLPDGAVEDLIARTSTRRVVDDPGTDRKVSYLALGARGKVLEGPMAGWQGICTMSGPNRIKLLMSLFGGTREIEFRTRMVEEA